jgi:CheY-like chemotaxis protein
VAADISQIVSTTEKAAGLTKKLMTFSRKQTYQPKVLDLNTLIINLENILSGLMESDIAIDMNLSDEIPRIYADPGQVEQVLINLIVNARDAVNENKNGSPKKIEIQTSTLILDDTILTHHIDMLPVDHICIRITDNGCGMSDEIQQRVYEPFFTTKPEGKGTGLGLSTVYGIIKQNKAIIDLESKVKQGTTFKIYWPSTDKVVKESTEEKGVPGHSQGNETILLVEDEEGIRNFAVVSLQQNGYTVHTAENGKKALQMIENEQIEFDLLVSDLHMPGMDGDELIEALQKKIPDLKTIIMSGYGDDIISHNGFLKGQINFLQKPFLLNTLLQKVRSTLDRN